MASTSSSRSIQSPRTPAQGPRTPSHGTIVRRSTTLQGTDRGDGTTPLCFCERPFLERVSWTPTNPARRFWNCAKSLISPRACRYFEFKDNPLNDPYYKRILLRMKSELEGHLVHEAIAEKEATILALEREVCQKEQELDLAGKELEEVREQLTKMVLDVAKVGQELEEVKKQLRKREEEVANLRGQLKLVKIIGLVLVVLLSVWMMQVVMG